VLRGKTSERERERVSFDPDESLTSLPMIADKLILDLFRSLMMMLVN